MALEKITEQQMNEQGVCAAPDILNGTPAQNKALFDRMVRNLVAPAINACVDAVNEVNKNQVIWGDQEANRVEAESGRVAAEEIRVENEKRRIANEETRNTEEQARIKAENERKLAESQRDRDFKSVLIGERNRETAENERTAAELARGSAEEQRAEEETKRNAAEEARAAAEKARAEAEAARVDEESGCVAQAQRSEKNAQAYAEGGTLYKAMGDGSEEMTMGNLGAKDYAAHAKVYAEGGETELNPHDWNVSDILMSSGAENFAAKAQAYLEGGTYKEYGHDENGNRVWKEHTVEKGAQQYAEDAANSAKKAEEAAGATKAAVRYTEQELTEEQQAQARENIGAAGKDDLTGIGAPGEGENAEVFNDTEKNVATGAYTHAEGCNTLADGDYSHAEGVGTAAHGYGSHAQGYGTAAHGTGSHAQGRYNVLDESGEYAHIVGNGRETARSNAHTLDWAGNAWFAGKVFVGGTGQDDPNAVELGTGSGGGDWNTLKNRPFGEEAVEILPETTLTGMSSGSGFTYKDLSNTTYDLIAGETYVVVWNGTSYTCVAQAYEDTNAGVTGVVLGETGAWVANAPAGNGEPFGIACLTESGSNRVTVISGESLTSVTFAIQQEQVKTIDPKYLPEALRFGDEAVFVAEAEVELDPTLGSGHLLSPLGLVVGKKYVINWNGSEYVCTAQSAEMSGYPLVSVGGSAGEPFEIEEVSAEHVAELGCNGFVYSQPGETSATIIVSEVVAKPIDPKYLPEDFGSGIDPSKIAGGAEAVVTLAECGVLTPAYEGGTFYTDTDGAIYIL